MNWLTQLYNHSHYDIVSPMNYCHIMANPGQVMGSLAQTLMLLAQVDDGGCRLHKGPTQV